MPILDSCCGCIPLRNGVISIGVFELFCSSYNLSTSRHNKTINLTSVFSIFCAGLLIHGTIKKNRFMLLPYLVQHMIGCIIGVIFVLLLFCSTSAVEDMIVEDNEASQETAETIQSVITLFAIGVIIAIALMLFFILVVYSYYTVLRDEENLQNGQPDQRGVYPVVSNEKFNKTYP